MMSMIDLEKLIADKRLQIEEEKTLLNLSSSGTDCDVQNANRDTVTAKEKSLKQVKFAPVENLNHNAAKSKEIKEDHREKTVQDLEESIPPDLERYIRRYLGLPVMLKAGEYSPNNPLVRGERASGSGDVLLGLGEYERRRQTLRRLRQQQYREYLDQQAKKKQEAKDQAERERRESEQRDREYVEREREREDREREQRARFLEQERSSEQRRASVCYTDTRTNRSTVDTGVQVNCISTPLSVAVQTDDIDFYQLSSSKCQLTEAERELSPHTVVSNDERPIQPAPWTNDQRRTSVGERNEIHPVQGPWLDMYLRLAAARGFVRVDLVRNKGSLLGPRM
ncbi:hypothetical protein evm_003568 [Chilo suppressalis]|nr:hypothetical protein evm_003568 [Chilo suppressalis]